MTTAARAEIPRSPVFNAVSAGLFLLSVMWILFILATPQSPLEMMVPWLRPVSLLQAVLGAACVALIWNRKGWAFYVYVGVIMLGLLVGLMARYPLPFLAIGPILLGLYLWALHSGSPSMWIQMFGRSGAPGGGMSYGIAPAMPPQLPTSAAAPRPPLPPPLSVPAPAQTSASAAPRSVNVDPLETLKRLGALRDGGAITDAEFAAKKAELLQRL